METRKKTGPKPKLFSELIARNAPANDCEVIRANNTNKSARIRCLSCSHERTVYTSYRFTMCGCKKKRPFYHNERTVSTHQQELVDRGFDGEYKVLRKIKKDVFRYEHLTCGRTFTSPIGYLWQNHTVRHVCTECRKDAWNKLYVTHQDLVDRLAMKMPGARIVGKYKPGKDKTVKLKYTTCSHTQEFKFVLISEPNVKAHRLICRICKPTSVWFNFSVAGKKFKTRSLVERKFVEFLVNSVGICPNDIDYEPKACRVPYICPVTGKRRSYVPDFRVKNALVEVKDLNSLGIGPSYYWQAPEEALAVNRVKSKAAEKTFKDYRTYVLIRGRFYKTRNFWQRSEKQRLKNL